jgi:hypothetical protein
VRGLKRVYNNSLSPLSTVWAFRSHSLKYLLYRRPPRHPPLLGAFLSRSEGSSEVTDYIASVLSMAPGLFSSRVPRVMGGLHDPGAASAASSSSASSPPPLSRLDLLRTASTSTLVRPVGDLPSELFFEERRSWADGADDQLGPFLYTPISPVEFLTEMETLFCPAGLDPPPSRNRAWLC